MPGPKVEISYLTHTAEGAQRRHYPLTSPQDFTIPNGDTGAGVNPIVLPANCRVLGICCTNAAGIQAGTNLTAEICFDNEVASSMFPLYEQDDPGTEWSQGALPTSGLFAFILTHAFRARRIRLVLSQVSTADVIFKVYGFDGVI